MRKPADEMRNSVYYDQPRAGATSLLGGEQTTYDMGNVSTLHEPWHLKLQAGKSGPWSSCDKYAPSTCYPLQLPWGPLGKMVSLLRVSEF